MGWSFRRNAHGFDQGHPPLWQASLLSLPKMSDHMFFHDAHLTLFITPSFFPVHPALQVVLGKVVVADIPPGPYVLPATRLPTLLFILRGNIKPLLPGFEQGEHPPLAPFGLSGPTTSLRHFVASPETQIGLISVKAGQLPRLLGCTTSEVMDVYTPLVDLIPGRIFSMLANTLEPSHTTIAKVDAINDFLVEVMKNQRSHDPSLIVPDSDLYQAVHDLAAQFNLGIRQFERRFQESYGQSLRMYRLQTRCNYMLLNTVVGQHRGICWQDMADAGGYVDQSHLSRDLKRFTGCTPGTLIEKLADGDTSLWSYHLPSPGVKEIFGGSAF